MKKLFSLFLIASLFAYMIPLGASAQTSENTVGNIIFPALITGGNIYYSNDFGDPRGGGTRSHEGVDIMGPKMTPLVAATDGTIRRVNYPEASWGYAVVIRDSQGYTYWYIHMNNDTPGTDDGQGGALNAYAPYSESGYEVKKGQVIGWMGDSGNAETTPPHLHFEIHAPDRSVINPYESLKNSIKIQSPTKPARQDDEYLPFGEFDGGASIAVGNFGISNTKEFVAGAGPGGAPHVRLMDTDNDPIGTFYAYDEGFRGGVNVATGDLDGDGIDEVITAPGAGGGPHVKIFNADGTAYKVEGFFAYTPAFTGGIRVTTADLDGDGKDEIITGAGPGGGPHVKIFRGDGTVYSEGFFAFDAGFRGGVDVAATSKTNNSEPRIIVGAGPGGGPHVMVFDPEGTVEGGFFAYDEGFRGGVKVAARIGGTVSTSTNTREHNDDDEKDEWEYDSYGRRIKTTTTSTQGIQIVTAPAMDGGADFRMFDIDGNKTANDTALERWWQGGYNVAAGEGLLLIAPTNSRLSFAEKRRASVWEIF